MAGPRVLSLVRPYRTELEYLEHEAWTLERRTMILVGAPPLEVGEHVRFSIVLTTGQRVVRAEGQVLGPQEACDGRPSGARVKFRRFDLATKELVERLEAERDAYEFESPPTSIQADIPSSLIVAPPPSEVHPVATLGAPSDRGERIAESVASDQRISTPPSSAPGRPKKSAPRASIPPELRDGLLERLRQRSRK